MAWSSAPRWYPLTATASTVRARSRSASVRSLVSVISKLAPQAEQAHEKAGEHHLEAQRQRDQRWDAGAQRLLRVRQVELLYAPGKEGPKRTGESSQHQHHAGP